MSRKRPDSESLIDRDITRRIIGAFFECYNHLGYGQFESVYRKALLHEMHLRDLTASERPPSKCVTRRYSSACSDWISSSRIALWSN